MDSESLTPDWADDKASMPGNWSADGVLGGVPAMNEAVAQSTLPAVMTPHQIGDVDWGGDAPAGGSGVQGFTPTVSSSEGGDANAVSKVVQSLDPRLSPLLGQLHWVAVPNSVDQDDKANINPDDKLPGYPETHDDGQLTYGDLDAAYDAPNSKHVIVATSGSNAGDGSYNTVFHETGHGLDGLSGNPSDAPSNSPDFKRAYENDVPLMTPGEDDYYLNKGSGPSESYAESFARYFGGDPTLQQDWPGMYKYWADKYPNVSPGQKWKWSEQ